MTTEPLSVPHGVARVVRRLWAAVTLFTLYATTIPFNFVENPADVHAHLIEAIQRSKLSHYAVLSRTDVLQNVLLFVPFGMCAVASLPFGWFASLVVTVASAMLLSTACEGLQLFTTDRVSSLWDVWANSGGALVGGIAFTLIVRGLARVSTPFAANRRAVRPWLPLLNMTALVCVAAWEPFDVTLDVGSVWSKVKPLLHGDVIWTPVTDDLLTALRFLVLTALLTRAIERSGAARRVAWLRAALACSLLAVALEASQIFITSRLPTVQDALDALAGVIVSRLFLFTGNMWRARLAWLAGGTALAASPFYLEPFTMAPQYASLFPWPFQAYYQRTSLETISHVLDLMMIYAPIGFAGAWESTGDGNRRALLMCVTIAAALEYGQGWVVGRYPDVTDVAMAVLGWAVGKKLVDWQLQWASGGQNVPAASSR